MNFKGLLLLTIKKKRKKKKSMERKLEEKEFVKGVVFYRCSSRLTKYLTISRINWLI